MVTKHRKGSLVWARASAKSKLKSMPVGSIAMVGQWIDNGQYEAKVGGGMNYHERFRPVEQVIKTARGTTTKKVVRGNPTVNREQVRKRRKQKASTQGYMIVHGIIDEILSEDYGLTPKQVRDERKAGKARKARGTTKKNPGNDLGLEGKSYTIKPTHIDLIRAGDTVIHDGKLKTVGSKNLKRGGFSGTTLWGDSYRGGSEKVKLVIFTTKKNPCGGRKKNPMQNLSSSKALGDHAIRIDGVELTAFQRNGVKLARHYYASEAAAKKAYRAIRSETKLVAWINRYGAKKNPNPRKCSICGKPVILSPSATERARRYGGKPSDYLSMFPTHAECLLKTRHTLLKKNPGGPSEQARRVKASKGPFYVSEEQRLVLSAAEFKRMWPGGKAPTPRQRQMLGWEKITQAEALKLVG